MFANQALAPTYCNAAPSFSCVAFALNRTGSFTVAALAGDRRHDNNKCRSLFQLGQRHRRLARSTATSISSNTPRLRSSTLSTATCRRPSRCTPAARSHSRQTASRQRLCQGLSGHHDDRLPLAELHLLQPAKHHEHDTADHTILRQVQLNAQVRAEGPQGRPTKTKLMYALKLYEVIVW